MLSRTMGDLGSAIRSNFLHFWLSYVSNIYSASETLGTTAQNPKMLLLAKK